MLRDISQPSFAINPDHVTQIVTTIDGRVLTGTVRSDGDKLKVANGQGEQVELAKEDVENIEACANFDHAGGHPGGARR